MLLVGIDPPLRRLRLLRAAVSHSLPARDRVDPVAVAGPVPGVHPYGWIRLRHILALALALRLVSLAIPTMVHPDEVFQYLEPAHRLAFGRGIVTWEWRHGIRSWLVPLAVAGPMALGAWLDPGGGLYLVLPKLAMTLASLVVVVVAWTLGGRVSRLHAIVAASVAAIWYEFVFFAPHILSDTIAVLLFLPAALVLLQRERWSDRRLVVAGLLLGLAALVRFQQLPAIAALAVCCCGTRLRDGWRPLVIGGLIGLLPGIACDLAAHRVPFDWLVENIRLNLVENRSADYGTSGPFGFIPMVVAHWSLWAVPILILAGVGARRYPPLAWTAAINLGVHMLIAHKEYRFVLLSATLAILLAAIGSVDCLGAVGGRRASRNGVALLLFGWLVASSSIAFGCFRTQWSVDRAGLELSATLRADPKLCGIAVYRSSWAGTGGYAYLHRDVAMALVPDIYGGDAPALLARQGRHFDTVLTTPDHAHELPPGYAEHACLGSGGARLCAYRRPGGCDASASPADVNAVLRNFDV